MSPSPARGVLPHYLRIKNQLRAGITAARWVAGQRLPSEADLMREFGISRMTANRVMRELEQEGLVDRVQGVGSFVAALHRVASTLSVRDIQEEIAERGNVHSSVLHSLGPQRADGATAALFGLAAGAELFHSVLVHFENGTPIQCERRLVNPACAPDYLSVDFSAITPTRYLLEVAPLSEARYAIEAVLPGPLDARLLGIAKHAPCLRLTRLTFSCGTAVTHATLTYPGSRYELRGSAQA